MKQLSLLVIPFLLSAFMCAQDSPGTAQAGQPATQFASGTVIPIELSKSLDAKKIKVGDLIEAKSSMDMLSQGKIVMPHGTKIVGHVTSVKAHSKESPDSNIGIAFDKAIMKDGQEMPLPAEIQAIAPPMNQNPLAASQGAPVGGMSPGMGGGGSTPMGGGSVGGASMGGSRSGGGYSPQSSYPSSGSQMPTGETSSGARPNSALGANSKGVIGLKGLELNSSGQASVVSCASKNVHLDSGTQLIVRVR